MVGADRPLPTTPSLLVETIPAELKARPQWVTWRYEWDGKRWTKVPYDAKSDRNASTTSPETWSAFDVVLTAARERGYDGIGFVFSKDDPYCGIDLDDCMDGDGKPVSEALALIDALDSYTEVSPSGRGVKIWVRGTLPIDGTGRKTGKVAGFGALEMYHRGRYFTVTGWSLA